MLAATEPQKVMMKSIRHLLLVTILVRGVAVRRHFERSEMGHASGIACYVESSDAIDIPTLSCNTAT